VRAALELRPYREAAAPTDPTPPPWWVLSDLGSDVRPGPLAPDHVLGIGAAALTLAQATPRNPAARALDIGTGCGIQALHLGRHCAAVTATDISRRALRLAATTAALSGQVWRLQAGSLLDPVEDEEFELVVANPPFVLSAGPVAGGQHYDYRDSGMAGDAVSARLVRDLPRVMAPGGTAQLLANWAITPEQEWSERVIGWLPSGCDAWVWQREIADPGEYVSLWLRDAGEQPGTGRWSARYDEWLDWFAAARIIAVGMGMVTLWRTDRAQPIRVLEDVRQPLAPPLGPAVSAWIESQRWLADRSDDQLLEARLGRAEGLVRARGDLAGPDGWQTTRQLLRQSTGLRWEVEVDDAIAALVAGCSGDVSLGLLLEVLAGTLGAAPGDVRDAALPVVRDLLSRGFLHPME
jgi:SAM-dependent methyltransferase